MILSPALAELLLFQPSRGELGAPPTLHGIRGRSLTLTTADELRIQAWWYELAGAEPAPAVLFFHGNAGDISHRTPMVQGLLREGLSVLLLEYRGYGESEGKPSEAGLYLDAEAGHDFLLDQLQDPSRIVLLGRSLGGAVAAYQAAARAPGGLILESAFTSLEAMAGVLYPFLPAFLFRRLRGRYATVERVPKVEAPLLVIHGTSDDLVPLGMGLELLEAARGHKEWLGVEGAGHNDVYWVGGESYFKRIGEFVWKQTGGRPQS